MRVHHISCGTMCPLGGRLISGHGSLFGAAKMVCHCLLVETPGGLLLVDSGLGMADVADPRGRLGADFIRMVRPLFAESETALRQVEALGFSRRDVRHILLTHLDLDHAGGISDFPEATVHVLADEHAAATGAPRHFSEKRRYRRAQWAHGPHWSLLKPGGEPFFGFDCVRDVPGLPPEVLLVPLAGHTRGHTGVAVESPGGWLLHCGDAYFHHGEVDPEKPYCPAGLAFFQRVMAVDDVARRRNRARLRELQRDRGAKIRLFSAHDPVELERLQAEHG